MCSFTYSFSFLFIIHISVFYVPSVLSGPLKLDVNRYSKFIDSLLKNNCTMPGKIKLPFPGSSDESHFDYFLTPLKACQTEDASKENNEATFLCSEIFDVIRNITCFPADLHSEIDSGPLSNDVCKGYQAMEHILPKKEDYLSGKLVDSTICKILCTSDKYELLCKTLLWSYETQAKIKNAIENKAIKIAETVDEVTQKVSSTIKVKLVQNNNTTSSKQASDVIKSDKSQIENSVPVGGENKQVVDSEKSDKQSNLNGVHLDVENSSREVFDSKESGKTKSSSNLSTSSEHFIPSEEEKTSESDLMKQEKILSETKSSAESDDNAQITSNKVVSSTSENQKEVTSSINNANVKSTVLDEKESKPTSKLPAQKDLTEGMSSKDTKSVESSKVSNKDSQDTPNNQLEYEIDDDKPSKGNTQAISTSNASGPINNSNENSKGKTDNGLKDSAKTDLSTKTYSKSEQPVPPTNIKTDNELGNVNLEEQENESKGKQTDSKLPANKDDNETPKLNDLEVPNETVADLDSKLPESTTLQMLPDEDADPHQEDKISDQYDTENDEYSKGDYDSSFNQPPKIKDSSFTSSNSADSGPLSNSYDYRNTGRNTGHSSGDIPMIPAFPEQEDGHFFFYFLSIVLILMAGYLIFHNKQKIIALIVEGRHERRRRSGPGYRKLETK